MKQIILLDLDGCISDDRWRHPFINLSHKEPNERWRRYHEHLIYDRFRNQHLVFGHTHSIIVITSRHERYRALTHSWFDRHEIVVEDMLMRADEDFRPSVEVKRDLLVKLLCDVDRFAIACAYDDRPDIVAMYHTFDICAEVHAIHPELDPRRLEQL